MYGKGAGRREFLEALVKYAAGGIAVAGTPTTLGTNYTLAQPVIQGQETRNSMSEIATFVVRVRYENVPGKALEWAKIAILDCLGTSLAGSKEESGRIMAEQARAEEAKEESTLYGHGFGSSAVQAAFVNGTAAHATDFDHSFVIGGQPTAPVIPAVFALGEALGVSGKKIIEAYVIGFEVATKLLFGSTADSGGGGPFGAYGATAGCARLLGLTEREIERAFGVTLTMSGGTSFEAGTMTKPLRVGLDARSAVLAPRMARSGFTAGRPSLPPLEDLGRIYSLEKYGVRLKPYPCGGLTHSAIFATIQLRNQHAITAEVVEHIDVAVPQGTANAIHYKVPETGLQAKFSMGYLVARALIDGKLMLDAFTDEAVRDRQVLDLIGKVEMRVDPALPASTSTDGSRPAKIAIKLKNGQTHELYQRFPKGGPQFPMTEEELREKFRACARGVVSDSSIERLITVVDSLETLASVRQLTGLLRGRRS
jgi:2-methylcitrate dehydratase PrpD